MDALWNEADRRFFLTGQGDGIDLDPLMRWDLEDIGLRYAPIHIPAETLVIGHIEKPSEN